MTKDKKLICIQIETYGILFRTYFTHKISFFSVSYKIILKTIVLQNKIVFYLIFIIEK